MSVVVPVFNGAAFLAQAIDSALSQTHPSVEVVVVDDGSTDDSADVLSGYGKGIRCVRQQNAGVAAARNRAIDLARGEFVAFLDQDDWWLPRKLAGQLAVFVRDERIGLVHGGVAYYDDERGDWGRRPDRCARPESIVGSCYERLLLGNYIVNSTAVVRRSVLDRVGRCNTSIAGNTVQDYDLWLRIAHDYHVGYEAEATTIIRLHPGQGHNNRPAMLSQELALLLRRHPEHEWLANATRRERLARLYDLLATAYFDDGDGRQARRLFSKALRVDPKLRQFIRAAASWLPFTLAYRARSAWHAMRGYCNESDSMSGKQHSGIAARSNDTPAHDALCGSR